MPQTVTRETLGAWLVKCDPSIWDIAGFVVDGGTTILSWSLQENYRSHLMKPGDPILLWVSGSHADFPRGVWGAGTVTGNARDSAVIDDADDPGYWRDDEARRKVDFRVPVDISLLLDSPVTDGKLRSGGIADLEVQRMPGGSNPSWVTRDQLAEIDALMEGARPEPPRITSEITVSDHGAGFGDPAQNRVVETAAMRAVTVVYEADGWDVTDVSLDKVGWDLTCTRGGDVARVEVKGVSGARPSVLLTANEVRNAKSQPGWVLAVVVHALRESQETLHFTAQQALDAAAPYVYRADLA